MSWTGLTSDILFPKGNSIMCPVGFEVLRSGACRHHCPLCTCRAPNPMCAHIPRIQAYQSLTLPPAQQHGERPAYTPAYQLLPSFLCLCSCRPGALRAGLPRGFQKTSQIMRGNVVISSQKAGVPGCGSRPPLPDLGPPSPSRRPSAVPSEPVAATRDVPFWLLGPARRPSCPVLLPR